MPLDQTALHRPVATLDVSCYWFPRPLVGSTYPRDHVKVARGLLSCALPQVEVVLGEEVSVCEAAGKDSLRVAGKTTPRYMQIDKNNMERSF